MEHFCKYKGGRMKEKFFNLYVFLGYLILPLIYFRKFITGKVMLYGSDWLLGVYFNKVWMSEFIENSHSIAYWNPYVFSGNSTVSSFFGDIMTPTMLSRFIIPTHIVHVLTYVFIISIASFGTYLLLKNIGIKRNLAILGGILYGWTGVIVSTTEGGHLGRTVSAALFPMIFYLIFMGLKKKRIRYFILAGGTGGLTLLMGHFQMAYYYVPTILGFVIWYLIAKRKEYKRKEIIKISSFLVLTFLVSTMMYSFYIFPVKMNLPYGARGASRGYEYATSWSMPPEETLGLFNPYFSGILDNYWGRNYFKLHTEFTGILVLLLFLGGVIFERKRGWVKFSIWLFVLSLLFAWGGHTFFYRIYYYLIPGIQKFRAPAMLFYQTVFAMVIAGMFFLNDLEYDRKKVYYIFGFSGFILLLALIFTLAKSGIQTNLANFISTKLYYSYSRSIVQSKISVLYRNYPLIIKGFYFSFLFALIYSGFLLAVSKNKFKKTWLFLAIGVVFLFEVWPIEKKFLKAVPHPDKYYASDGVVDFLKRDSSKFRIFPLQYEHDKDGLLALHGLQNVGGYAPNPLKVYQNYIGAGNSVMFQPSRLILNPKLIDLLNVKYLIDRPLPEDISGYPERVQNQIKQWKNFILRYKEIYRTNKYIVFKNPDQVPRIYMVHLFNIQKDYEFVLGKIGEDDFSPLDSCYLDESPSYQTDENIKHEYSIDITSYSPNQIILQVNSNAPGIVIFSENYYPRWKARVDGRGAKVYRTNYLFRGVEIPEGNHKVEMVYDNTEEKKGIILSFIGYLIFLSGFFFPQRERVKESYS
jgi:hypothetical protein